MHAMILAAGLGKRMRSLTKKTAKAMLEINGKPLIQYHIENLVRAGIVDITINYSFFGKQIEEYLGNGEKLGAHITYSPEHDKPLETAGGIVAALPLLPKTPFITINADIWTDFPLQRLKTFCHANSHFAQSGNLAHLILVDNPPHNVAGDFYLEQTKVYNKIPPRDDLPLLTFSGISVFAPKFFRNCSVEIAPLAPLLQQTVACGKITADHYHGVWQDIGTPERLQSVRDWQKNALSKNNSNIQL